MSLAPGSRLGAYEVRSLIGAGGMGEVYRATDARLGRDVADPDRLARFKREAQLLASLNHPNIGGIYGSEEFDGVQAMKRCQLRSRLLKRWRRRTSKGSFIAI